MGTSPSDYAKLCNNRGKMDVVKKKSKPKQKKCDYCGKGIDTAIITSLFEPNKKFCTKCIRREK